MTPDAPNFPADVRDAYEFIRRTEARVPDVALILGSGLGDLADAAEDQRVFATADLPGYPHSSVEGHKGRLVFGRLEGKNVVFVQGRVHLYEGHTARDTAFPVRLLHSLGVRNLIVTNAAGGINSDFGPGTLMFIEDVMNHTGRNPLIGPNNDGGPRFPDMTWAMDPDWLAAAKRIAGDLDVATEQGVYIWVTGPSFETKAEIRSFRLLGADAVGMSTVPEVIQAVYHGMRVLGLSTITNPAAGLNEAPLTHEEVMEVGQQVRADLERLLRGIVRER